MIRSFRHFDGLCGYTCQLQIVLPHQFKTDVGITAVRINYTPQCSRIVSSGIGISELLNANQKNIAKNVKIETSTEM